MGVKTGRAFNQLYATGCSARSELKSVRNSAKAVIKRQSGEHVFATASPLSRGGEVSSLTNERVGKPVSCKKQTASTQELCLQKSENRS